MFVQGTILLHIEKKRYDPITQSEYHDHEFVRCIHSGPEVTNVEFPSGGCGYISNDDLYVAKLERKVSLFIDDSAPIGGTLDLRLYRVDVSGLPLTLGRDIGLVVRFERTHTRFLQGVVHYRKACESFNQELRLFGANVLGGKQMVFPLLAKVNPFCECADVRHHLVSECPFCGGKVKKESC